IEALAEFESSKDLLRTAIHSLLGLDLVDQLGNDLAVLERRKKTELRTGEERRKIESLQAEIDQLTEQRTELVQHRAAAQNDLDGQKNPLRCVQARSQAEGGDLFTRRQETETERSAIEKQLRTFEEELREVAAGSAPLLLVADLLQSVEQQDQIEQRARKAEE